MRIGRRPPPPRPMHCGTPTNTMPSAPPSARCTPPANQHTHTGEPTMSAMTFEALTKAVRNIVARCEYLEERAATANRGDIRGTASDRLRWGLLSHVAGVVAREYADQLALELSRIAEDAAASDTFDADGAAVEMVIHWARHCGRVV